MPCQNLLARVNARARGYGRDHNHVLERELARHDYDVRVHHGRCDAGANDLFSR